MSWTDERVTVLKKLWGEGKTAAEIASTLGGVTRNAVIGKAHRLKLSNRASPIVSSKKSVKPKVVKSSKPKPANANVSPPRKQVILSSDKDRPRLPLAGLGAQDCRWPMGDPQHDDFGFCGDPIASGVPYCLEHTQVAYQAATRNKIIKAEEAQVRATLNTKGAKKAASK